MGFLNDLLNLMLADSGTQKGGDLYFTYMLIRDDMESRARQKKLEEERKEQERQRAERLADLKHREFRLMEERNRSILAKNQHEEASKQAEESAKKQHEKAILNWVGCETFEELFEKFELESDENWVKLVDAVPNFEYFQQERKRYLKRLNKR